MIEVIIEEGDSVQRRELPSLPVLIGRADDADIQLEDSKVSRRHARIVADAKGAVLEDLGGANGSYRNDIRVARVLLMRGDVVRFGECRMTYLGDAVREETSATSILSLEEIRGGESVRHEIWSLPAAISSDEGADVQLQGASGAELRLVARDESLWIETLGAKMKVNGKSVQEKKLVVQDEILLGGVVLRYLGGDIPLQGLVRDISVPGLRVQEVCGLGFITRSLLARQEALDRNVVLKVMRDRWLDSKSVRAAYQRQNRIQSRVKAPGLASGIDIGESEGRPYFVTEYLSGENLKSLVQRKVGLEPGPTIKILKELLATLEAVHAQAEPMGGLKPSRVIVDGDQARITSIGFALPNLDRYPDEKLEDLAYLPPENRHAPQERDARGDLYEVGALAHYMLRGRAPRRSDIRSDLLRSLVDDPLPEPTRPAGRAVPPALRKFIQRLSALDPSDRPESARMALDELVAVEKSIETIRTENREGGRSIGSEGEVPYKKTARFKMVSGLVSVLIMIALNAGLYLGWKAWNDRRTAPKENHRPVETVGQNPAPIENVDRSSRPEPVVPPAISEDFSAPKEQWAALEKSLAEEDHYPRAVEALEGFVAKHPGAPQSSEALKRIASLRFEWRREAERLLDQVVDHVNAKDGRRAQATLKQARGLAVGVADVRLAEVERQVTRFLEDAAVAAGSDQPDPEKPVGSTKPPEPAPAAAPANRAKVLAALRSPFKLELVQAGVPLAKANSRNAAVLSALDRSMSELYGAMATWEGQEIEVIRRRGKPPVSGKMVVLEANGLQVRTDAGEIRIPFEEVAMACWADWLRKLGPSVDRYIARAWFNELAGRKRELWYDLLGVMHLEPQDSKRRQLAARWLDALRSGGRAPSREPKTSGEKRSMRICFVFEGLFPAKDRSARHIEALSRRFSMKGHGVSVVTTAAEDERDPEGIETLRLSHSLAKVTAKDGNLFVKKIAKHLKSAKIDLLFAEGLTPLSALAVKAATEAGLPTIVRVLADREGIRHAFQDGRKTSVRMVRKKITSLLEHAAVAAVSTPRCGEMLAEYFEGPTHVIERCVDLNVFRAGRTTRKDRDAFLKENDAEEKRILLYARDELRESSPKELLPLLSLLRDHHEDLLLMVMGNIDDQDGFMKHAEEVGVEDMVRLVPYSEGRGYFASFEAATAFLVPPSSRASGGELLEAMALGCPIVCFPETQRLAGHVIDGERGSLVLTSLEGADPKEVVRPLGELLGDQESLEQLRDGALETAREHDLIHAIDRVEQLCIDVLGWPEADTKVESADTDVEPADTEVESGTNAHATKVERNSKVKDKDSESSGRSDREEEAKTRKPRNSRNNRDSDAPGDSVEMVDNDRDNRGRGRRRRRRGSEAVEELGASTGIDVLEPSPHRRRRGALEPGLTLKDLMPFLRPPKTVLVIGVATGNGHARAAAAIVEALKGLDRNLLPRQVDLLDLVDKVYRPQLVRNILDEVSRHPALYGRPFETGDPEEIADISDETKEVLDKVFGKKLEAVTVDKRPDYLVCTHWLPLNRLNALREEGRLSAGVIAAVCDPAIHDRWLSPVVSDYIVHDERVRQALINRGVEGNHVHVAGFPVSPAFATEPDRNKVVRELGIDSKLSTVLFRPGGVGSTERISALIQQMLEAGGPPESVGSRR